MSEAPVFGVFGLTFAEPRLLLLLLLVPMVAALLWWLAAWRRRAARLLAGREPAGRVSRTARLVKAALLLTGLSLIVIAAAGPRAGSTTVLLPREGTDVVIALDVSTSMLAADIQPNRLEHAKGQISRLLDQLQGDRVGLVIFAGNAILRFPLTTDIEAARALVRATTVREGNLRPGTGISEALRVAGSAFGEEGARSRVIVLISDGEEFGAEGASSPRGRSENATRVFTIGIGTEEGSTIVAPETRGGQPRARTDPATGAPAISRANEALMRRIAGEGGGRYFDGNGDEAIPALAAEIAALERTKFASQEGTVPVEQYQWFLLAGVLLIAIESIIPERRRRGAGGAATLGTEQRRAA